MYLLFVCSSFSRIFGMCLLAFTNEKCKRPTYARSAIQLSTNTRSCRISAPAIEANLIWNWWNCRGIVWRSLPSNSYALELCTWQIARALIDSSKWAQFDINKVLRCAQLLRIALNRMKVIKTKRPLVDLNERPKCVIITYWRRSMRRASDGVRNANAVYLVPR